MNVWYSISSGCYSEGNIEMIKNIPNNKLLLESDSPSMFNHNIYSNSEDYTNSFIPIDKEKNNYKNSPISIIYLNKKIAEIKGMTLKELCSVIDKNNQSILDAF